MGRALLRSAMIAVLFTLLAPILCLGAFAPGLAAQETAPVIEAADGLFVALQTANIRQGPSLESPRIGRLEKSARIQVTGRVAAGDWLRVKTPDGRVGFVHGPLLQTLNEAKESQIDLAFWQAIKDSRNAADFEAYLESFPQGRFAALARARRDRLRPEAVAKVKPMPAKPAAEQVAALPPKPAKPAAKPAPVDASDDTAAAALPEPASADPPTRPAVTASGWDFLLAQAQEAAGYGLYSYLLFPVNDAASRPRYRAALRALQGQIDPVAAVARAGYKSYETNITYLPVTAAVADAADLDWLVEHHDFARAKRILAMIGEEPSLGPYLVSHLAPLTAGPPAAQDRLLVQDLAWVPEEVVALWLEQFSRDVKQPRYWDGEHLESFMLNARSAFAVVAKPFDIGAGAVERFIGLKRALAAEPD